MDYAASHVVYVDTRISRDLDGKYIAKSIPESANTRSEGVSKARSSDLLLREVDDICANINAILSIFDGGR